MSEALEQLRNGRIKRHQPGPPPPPCVCGQPTEVRLNLVIREKKPGASGGNGQTLASRSITLCAGCAVTAFEAAVTAAIGA